MDPIDSAPCTALRYAAGIIDGKLVIAGGTYWTGTPGHWTKKLYSASTDAFDPISQRWEKLPDLPVPLGYPASTVVGGKLFVLGGYTGLQVNRKIFVLKKSDGRYSWSVLRERGPGRIFASAVSWGKAIYLVGGTTSFEAYDAAGTCCTSKTATSTLLRFDMGHPARGWRKLSPYPGAPRWLPAVAIHGKSIWLFGGIFESDPKVPPTEFDGVLKYDLTQGRWNVMPRLPKPVATIQPLCSLALGNNIFLFTGHKQVWQFNLRTQRYSETTPMPESVYVDRFFWVDERIIGAGGESTPAGPRRRSPWTIIARLSPPSK
ncbi:MAG: Kelch repeat-containing protein [Terriglobia bacterium]